MTTSQESHQERISENSNRRYADLPPSTKLLYDLEQHLQGEPLIFAEWLRIAYEINEDFEDSILEVTTNICNSFKQTEKEFGCDIAKSLYNTQVVVLPNEIIQAGKYLSIGGGLSDIREVANAGFFMDDKNYDEMKDLVEIVSSHECVGDAIESILLNAHSAYEQKLSM